MPKAYDHAIMGSFWEKKHFAYSQHTGSTQMPYWFMTVASFQTVFDTLCSLPSAGGVRIYLGYADPATTLPDNLSSFSGSLLLIFTAMDTNGDDVFKTVNTTPCFVVTPPVFPGGGAMLPGQVVQLSHADAQPFVEGYANTILPLSQAAVTAVRQKYGTDATTPAFKETTSFKVTTAWKNDVYTDLNSFYKIEAFTFYLGAFSDDTGQDDAARVLHQNALVLQYAASFDHNGHTYYYHFNIESVPKPVTAAPAPTTTLDAPVFGDDTIYPCPPYTCSGTSF